MKVIRKKNQFQATDNIKNTFREITINGQKNENYDKNVLGSEKSEKKAPLKPTI